MKLLVIYCIIDAEISFRGDGMFKNWCSAFKLLVALGGLSACSSVNGFPERVDTDTTTRIAALQSKYFLPTVDVLAVYKAETDKQAYRDTVIYGRLLALDLQFSVFQKALYKEGIVSNLTLDMIGLGLGAAGGLVSENTSQILSALSGGVAGARASINKNLYYERTLPALLALMEAKRAEKRTEIYQGLLQGVDVYPLGKALADLEIYYYAGSIPGAVASLTEEAGKTQLEAKAEQKALRDAAYVDIGLIKKIRDMVGMVDTLEDDAALALLTTPPAPFNAADVVILDRAFGRGGGLAARIAAATITDAQARAGLKRILALTDQRTDTDVMAKWVTAIEGMQKP